MQLALWPAPPAPLQLALELPTVSTTTSTPKGPTMTTSTPPRRRGPLRRLLDRLTNPTGFGSPTRPFPNSTPNLTPDDWRVIRLALQRAVVEHTAADRWPAAEAAQRTLDKTAPPFRLASFDPFAEPDHLTPPRKRHARGDDPTPTGHHAIGDEP